MTPRRRLVALAGVGAVLLAAACGGDAAERGTASGPAVTPSGRVTVLAAASLAEVFTVAAREFESAHPGTQVVLSTAGSSRLAQQVLAGAPADVLAVADAAPLRDVEEAGLTEGPATAFATNHLVLVVPPGNPAGVRGIADLADPDLVVALCAPQVPCGAASERLLAASGVAASPDTLEQAVTAVLTKTVAGEVDAGLVYATDAQAAGERVDVVPVPGAERIGNEYVLAVLSGAPNPRAARAFAAFVSSERGGSLLADAGFGSP